MSGDEFVANLRYVHPELLLAAAGLVFLTLGAALEAQAARVMDWACAAVLVLAAAFAVLGPDTPAGGAFNGMLVVDAFARIAKPIAFLAAAVALLLARGFLQRENLARYEFGVLVLFAALGMGVMISARDLLSLYLGLELQSLTLYVLASLNRDSARSTEAGVKYFVLGALSSGLLLYGLTLTYGAVGATDFAAVAATAAEGPSILLLFGLVFLIAGLAFKISAAPFHMWTPDVYEGAPTPITAMFAAAPKVAAMALLVRLTVEAFGGAADSWRQVIAVAALLSMALGAFAAIGQTNIKRLLAYSSIGHMGYALVALAAGGESGVAGVLVYLALYAIMTLGAFACVIAMRRPEGQVEAIEDLAGLSRTRPGMALAFAVILFSLAGVPPTAGFWGKWLVFAPAVEAGLLWLAIAGFLAAVVAGYYYLRIIKVMYFDEPGPAFTPIRDGPVHAAIAGSAIAMFPVLFVFIGPIRRWAEHGASALF